MRLLSTVPTLASFVAKWTRFEAGSAETVEEWLTVSVTKRGAERKAEQEADEDEEHDDENKEEDDLYREEGMQGDEREDEESEEGSEVELASTASGYVTPEVTDDPSLPQRYGPLLLFLHALAAKPSFVHLKLDCCEISPLVMDHMPVWPYLQCLSVPANEGLENYMFANAAARFPSLTSLSTSNCSNAAIEQLVRLRRLEELCFPEYSWAGQAWNDRRVRTTERGFRAFSKSASLRSVQYIPPERNADREVPSLTSLTALSALTNLTRLTIGAHWLDESTCVQLFTRHRFDHLRCLELMEQYDHRYDDFQPGDSDNCPQTEGQQAAC